MISAGKQAIADYFAPDPELEAALEAKQQALDAVRRATELARIHQAEQTDPRGLGDAVAHGEQFAGGEPSPCCCPTT